MNTDIINEFEKLISFISEEIDKFYSLKDFKKVTSNQFRLRQFKNVLSILKKHPDKITLDNYMQLQKKSGIGKGSLNRIKEILNTGSLDELTNFVDTKKEKTKIIEDLESVVGIGHVNALEFFNQGIKSVKDLKKKVNKGEIEVNDKILLGLKYYGKFQGNIPRKEINKINKIFNDIINKMQDHYIFEFCGSYRREQQISGDIDILISKKGILDPNINYLENIINLLKESIKKNSDQPLLIDDITDKNIHTKYMGFCKYKKNPPRRIDIRFVPYESYFSALLYFTGSAELNKQMRNIAKSKNLKLSEYGLFRANGDKIIINSERDIFDALDMEYLLPRLR